MKLAILSLLLPVTSFAADIQCTSTGLGGADIAIGIKAEAPLDRPGTVVEITSQGMRSLRFVNKVTQSSRPAEGQVVLNVRELDKDLIELPNGVAAKISLNLANAEGREEVTAGKIEIEKSVRRGITFIGGTYELFNCRGSL